MCRSILAKTRHARSDLSRARHFKIKFEYLRYSNFIGSGTWIRTRIRSFKGCCPTIRRSPNMAVIGEMYVFRAFCSIPTEGPSFRERKRFRAFPGGDLQGQRDVERRAPPRLGREPDLAA